ncbi:bifunctional diguanylate cyclase/phosphodiesterase [Psychrosphaera haliotis]|uniref:EAL domain-containing protein n=1 Tax=Psychrosphaera haliotis TaxID=555083 RepID=A0A6N8FFD8_9GAMM|nr:bifunctional diguanylate cyclase/phosphodiesterase [Psychrosphaera haliotis]MUH72971.1 EAL domain-containing protein [Psychrosphaera haliotis]
MATDKAIESKFGYLKKELKNAKTQLTFSIIVLFIVSMWYSHNTIKVHKDYQSSLMSSVSQQVVNEYQNHIAHRRQQIDRFQWRHQTELLDLYRQGALTEREDYLFLLKELRNEISGVRLFSIFDKQGVGVFRKITGDFLDDCQQEIDSTINNNGQEAMFLHKDSSSVHYDILQSLIGAQDLLYLFVAFEPTALKSILERYRLPQQELFLLRNDRHVEIELKESSNSTFSNVVMSEAEFSNFSSLVKIPKTRWSVGVRLSDNYANELFWSNYQWSFIVWAVVSLVLFLSYISQKKKSVGQMTALKQLEFSKSHDTLTGLMTRDVFSQYFNNKRSSISENQGVAFVIDIDKFQVFNNSLGFTKGDSVLRMLAEEIRKVIPIGAKISRISNDQFAVLDSNMNHTKAQDYAHFLKSHIENLDLSNIEESLSLTSCIGVVKINAEVVDSEHLMSSLLLTLKLAKNKGRNQVLLYQSDDPELVQHAQEMEIYHAIQRALNEDSFQLYRQEIRSNLSNCENSVYEVLLRMFDSMGNIVSPALFIPIAEQHSLAAELDKWVIARAFKNMAISKTKDHYCINLSGQTLADPSMVGYVKQKIEQFGVLPQQVTFEITETFAITHLESAIYFIGEITKYGCQFALDDFGSGLSSFSYLQKLPVQKLKIDGVFIKNITKNSRNQAFVSTMVTLAKSMEMETVAEFVETEEEFTMLKELNLDFCQGYFFHKPDRWIVNEMLELASNNHLQQ